MPDSAVVETARREVREWVAEHWDPEAPLSVWRGLLADSGWGCPTWPHQWFGRDLPPEVRGAVAEELERFGAVGTATVGVGMLLAAPILLTYGSDELKSQLLRRIVTSEDRWCELFSEPGCGSDLASLTTSAQRDGDEWVINGQKVWTTGARQASFALLLARTDWSVPKHQGITCFVLPMRQAGVDVRALRQMNNHATFNEVFLTDARVPHANVIGEVGKGWPVALATLSHERALGAAMTFAQSSVPASGRTAREAAVEESEFLDTYRWYPQRAGRPDLVIEHARAMNVNRDPLVRQDIVRLFALERAAKWTRERGAANQASGKPPGPEASLAKLLGSRIARMASAVHARIAGPNAMLMGPHATFGGIIAEVILSVPAGSIAGGTDEIQRNIIGEKVLGLPREPALDIGVPFNEVRTNERRER
jgi:alkylation response protein AidB-like acyl-CoA dehydrogenase